MSIRISEKHKAQVYRMFLIYCDKIIFFMKRTIRWVTEANVTVNKADFLTTHQVEKQVFTEF